MGEWLNVRQVSRELGIAYGDIYQTIRFFANGRIPVRKVRGRLLIPADALPLLLKIHFERKNPPVPKGWVKVSEFCRRHQVNNYLTALRWAQKLGILAKFHHNRYYIHEDSTEEIRMLLSICKTGRPPPEWIPLTKVFRHSRQRQRVFPLLHLVQPFRIGKSVYLRRDELVFLIKELEVMKRGRNLKVSIK